MSRLGHQQTSDDGELGTDDMHQIAETLHVPVDILEVLSAALIDALGLQRFHWRIPRTEPMSERRFSDTAASRVSAQVHCRTTSPVSALLQTPVATAASRAKAKREFFHHGSCLLWSFLHQSLNGACVFFVSQPLLNSFRPDSSSPTIGHFWSS